MADLAGMRRSFRTVAIVLLVVDVAAAAYLLSPLGRSRRAYQDRYERARTELQVRTREVLPLRGMEEKLKTSQGQIERFYEDRLPSHGSDITRELGDLAEKHHVRISTVRYETKPAEVPDLQRVAIEATLTGDYEPIVRLVNALERDRVFFIVDSVALTEQQGGQVSVALKLESYLRSGA